MVSGLGLLPRGPRALLLAQGWVPPHCQADLDWVAALEDIMDMLEARTGTVFEQGYNSEIRSMRLTLDPVNVRTDHWQSGIRQHPGKSPPIHDLRSSQRRPLLLSPLCLRFIWRGFDE